jgi:hypothetical protein
MKARLQKAESLQDCFDILSEYYELENCKPGFLTKSILISKLEDAVTYMRAQARKQYK